MEKIELLGSRLDYLLHRAKKLRKISSIDDLARKIAYSPQSITYWRRNQRRVPKVVIPIICRELGITQEFFLKNTIQVSGKKLFVNFSRVNYYQIREEGKYPGLTETEVQNVLAFKQQNPNHSFEYLEENLFDNSMILCCDSVTK